METSADGRTTTTTTTTITNTVAGDKPAAPPLPKIETSTADAFVSSTYLPYKKRLLEIMRGAKERVILGTSLLADSEIVSFLYLAKYRGLKVTVILDPRYVRARSSRYTYLRKNGIPTIIHKMAKLPLQQDFLKVDTHSYSLKGFLAPKFVGTRRYEIYKEPIYVDAKLDAMLAVIGTRPGPRNPRWRPRTRRGRIVLPGAISSEDRVPAEGYNYNYGIRQTKAPPGMATALPKRTITQEAARKPRPAPVLPRPVFPPNLPANATETATEADASDANLPAHPAPVDQPSEPAASGTNSADPFSEFDN